jgi:hypothetical protein
MQVLFETDSKTAPTPNLVFLNKWNAALKPMAYVGIDPERECVQYNTKSSTPVNMLIDAKTRKVLHKSYGYNKTALIVEFKKYL